jgi:hypothetical protein
MGSVQRLFCQEKYLFEIGEYRLTSGVEQNHNPKELEIKASGASYELTPRSKHRSQCRVYETRQRVDNQMTSFPHLALNRRV